MNARSVLLGAFVVLLGVGGFAKELTTEEEAVEQKKTRAATDEIAKRGVAPEKQKQPQPARAVRPEVAQTARYPDLPSDVYVERRFKTFRCPAELQIPSGTSFTDRTGLKFVRASESPGGCQTDLSPDTDKGGYCLTCGYEANVFIRRSSGLNYKCWTSDARNDEFTCEYVAPLPPSKTCVFEIRLPDVNLMPYTDHTKGDKDLHSYNGYFGSIIDLEVNAEIQRGIGPQSSALFLVLSATQYEVGGDESTFERPPYAIKLRDQHYVNATATDVATCLNSYGSQRPLSINPKGIIDTRNFGHNWETVETWKGRDNLIDRGECRFDTKYDDDMKRVGCRKIVFKQDVTARLN